MHSQSLWALGSHISWCSVAPILIIHQLMALHRRCSLPISIAAAAGGAAIGAVMESQLDRREDSEKVAEVRSPAGVNDRDLVGQ